MLEPAGILLEIHDHLDQPLGLTSLARRSGYSPFHFHRLFTDIVGETPKQHVQRLRLERAAYLLAVTDTRVLVIALDVGFHNHETFSRAFQRRFRMSPTTYRSEARRAQADRLVTNHAFRGQGCVLAEVLFGRLSPTRLIVARRMGAYADLALPPFGPDDTLWAPLVAWAQAAGAVCDRTAWSICHDDPTLTPGPMQRLDGGVPAVGEVPASDRFRVMEFAGGSYAGTEHCGPHDTIIQAYRHVADGIRRSDTFTFGSGPPVQIFRHVDDDTARHRTEVYFPIVNR